MTRSAADCPFCAPPTTRLVEERAAAFAFEDRYPVTEGHTLVIPRRCEASIFDLPASEWADLWDLVTHIRNRLMARPGVDGVNVGVNDGTAAGQTVRHAHIHLIPRRAGDVPDPRGGVRWVIPEEAAYWEEDSPDR